MGRDATCINSGERQELQDFTDAVEEKITYARKHNKCCLIPVLYKIKNDMLKWTAAYEEGSKTFGEVYEDMTYLYVFAETYVISAPTSAAVISEVHEELR